jgi:hypothetical protein
MQQRQLRLGDILDDYCPRERRLTNHAVVAMVGDEVKQTRCATCDSEHEYKHARVPRQRRKSEPAALYSQVAAGAPKKVVHETAPEELPMVEEPELLAAASIASRDEARSHEARQNEDRNTDGERGGEPHGDEPIGDVPNDDTQDGLGEAVEAEEGPVHRPLIRAQLPRTENQPPPARPGPDFTIRQPTSRHNRFRPRQQRSGQVFQGNRSGGNFSGNRGGAPPHGGRPPMGASRMANRHGQHGHQGPGRKRSK